MSDYSIGGMKKGLLSLAAASAVVTLAVTVYFTFKTILFLWNVDWLAVAAVSAAM